MLGLTLRKDMSEEGGMPGLLLLARLISSCAGSSRKAVAGRQ